MTKIDVIPEKDVWSLSKIRDRGWTEDFFPIIVRGGQVAINAARPLEVASVICATHRTNLISDFSTLTAEKPQLERICPIPDCQTRAVIGPIAYKRKDFRQSQNHTKKYEAAIYLRIHGPKAKPSH